MVGPGKALDTNRFFVISSIVLVGAGGQPVPQVSGLMEVGKHMEHLFQIYL